MAELGTAVPGRREPFVIPESAVRSVATPALARGAVRSAFAAIADPASQSPFPMSLCFPDVDGEVHVKGGHVAGAATFVIKVASGFYRNPESGLPSGSGVSLVLSARTGQALAVVCDNGFLTDLRTGAAGALAADLLARRDARHVAIVGAGMQARFQLEALLEVRRLERLTAYSRTRARAEAFAREAEARFGLAAAVAETADSAVAEADLVVTVTPSRRPLFDASAVPAGAHITAVGSDMPDKQELDPAVLGRAAVVAVDDEGQARTQGELHHAAAAGALEHVRIVTLTDLVLGRKRGRERDDEITVADLTGLGIQDAAIGSAFYERYAQHVEARGEANLDSAVSERPEGGAT